MATYEETRAEIRRIAEIMVKGTPEEKQELDSVLRIMSPKHKQWLHQDICLLDER